MSNNSEDQQIQILKNIEQLQTMEKNLYKELENSSSNTNSIITKINQLSDIRISLFKTLNYNYVLIQNNVNNKRSELVELMAVVNIVEEELNNAKKQLIKLYEIKNNKMRMVEINTYYGKQYMAQSRLLKLIIFVGVILLILAILWKKTLLSDSVAKVLIGIVLVLGGFLILRRIIDISTRDNMNFDSYNWFFNPATQKPTVYEYDKAKLMGMMGDVEQTDSSFNGVDCIGDACCTKGMKYDSAIRKCIENVAPETFITGQLTKHCFSGIKEKDVLDGNKPVPYGSDESINFASVQF